jgi:hypothetical protein
LQSAGYEDAPVARVPSCRHAIARGQGASHAANASAVRFGGAGGLQDDGFSRQMRLVGVARDRGEARKYGRVGNS